MGNSSQIRLVFKLVSSQFAATWLEGWRVEEVDLWHKGSRKKINTGIRNQRDEHKLVEVSCCLKFGAGVTASSSCSCFGSSSVHRVTMNHLPKLRHPAMQI